MQQAFQACPTLFPANANPACNPQPALCDRGGVEATLVKRNTYTSKHPAAQMNPGPGGYLGIV
jgi:hypothetical protein